MKSSLILIPIIACLICSCGGSVKESTVHRRNFSKNVFEEEFASVQVGCDTVGMKVFLPNTKWLSIAPKHLSKTKSDQHIFELNKKLELRERTYDHELILEKIQNGAFLFRYKGVQTITDTLQAIRLDNVKMISKIKLDSSMIFSFEGSKYYKVKKSELELVDTKTIYKSMRTEDLGRVVCKCDYFTD